MNTILISKIEHEGTKSQSLTLFGSFVVIQEILAKNTPNINKLM